MQGIGDILSRKDFDVPPEVEAIKTYIRRHYDAEVTVTVQQRGFVVSARSAGLISTLRMNLPKLQKAAGTDKPITLRIG